MFFIAVTWNLQITRMWAVSVAQGIDFKTKAPCPLLVSKQVKTAFLKKTYSPKVRWAIQIREF